MNDAQIIAEAIKGLSEALTGMSTRTYTLTGASDWPMFIFLFGVIGALISFMWFDLRSRMGETKKDCSDCKKAIWGAIDRRDPE